MGNKRKSLIFATPIRAAATRIAFWPLFLGGRVGRNLMRQRRLFRAVSLEGEACRVLWIEKWSRGVAIRVAVISGLWIVAVVAAELPIVFLLFLHFAILYPVTSFWAWLIDPVITKEYEGWYCRRPGTALPSVCQFMLLGVMLPVLLRTVGGPTGTTISNIVCVATVPASIMITVAVYVVTVPFIFRKLQEEWKWHDEQPWSHKLD